MRKLQELFLRSQEVRFLVVGAINTLFGYTVYAIFIYFGMYYPIAVFVATLVGIIFNFLTTGHIVFKQAHGRLFWRFSLVYGLVYFVNISFLKIGTYFSHNLYLLGAAAIPVCAVMAFLLNKYFVFARESHEAH
jgi:putative flippase GtrA